MKYPIGTKYIQRGKAKNECTVIDYHVTKNLAGEIVKECYVSEHYFLGQRVLNREVRQTSIDMALGE